MRPATKVWEKRIDQAIMVDAFASRYGWDWHTIEAQPAWLIDQLTELWAVRAEVRANGGGNHQGQGGHQRMGPVRR